MVACRGRVQREGDVIHVVVEHLEDLTSLLRDVGNRDELLTSPGGLGRMETETEMASDEGSIRIPTRSFR